MSSSSPHPHQEGQEPTVDNVHGSDILESDILDSVVVLNSSPTLHPAGIVFCLTAAGSRIR